MFRPGCVNSLLSCLSERECVKSNVPEITVLPLARAASLICKKSERRPDRCPIAEISLCLARQILTVRLSWAESCHSLRLGTNRYLGQEAVVRSGYEKLLERAALPLKTSPSRLCNLGDSATLSQKDMFSQIFDALNLSPARFAIDREYPFGQCRCIRHRRHQA